jgi:hypothetical protein
MKITALFPKMIEVLKLKNGQSFGELALQNN